MIESINKDFTEITKNLKGNKLVGPYIPMGSQEETHEDLPDINQVYADDKTDTDTPETLEKDLYNKIVDLGKGVFDKGIKQLGPKFELKFDAQKFNTMKESEKISKIYELFLVISSLGIDNSVQNTLTDMQSKNSKEKTKIDQPDVLLMNTIFAKLVVYLQSKGAIIDNVFVDKLEKVVNSRQESGGVNSIKVIPVKEENKINHIIEVLSQNTN